MLVKSRRVRERRLRPQAGCLIQLSQLTPVNAVATIRLHCRGRDVTSPTARSQVQGHKLGSGARPAADIRSNANTVGPSAMSGAILGGNTNEYVMGGGPPSWPRRFLIKKAPIRQYQDQDPLGVPEDGAATARNASDFHAAIAAPETQLAFSKVKGLVPVRADFDMSSMTPYQHSAANALRTSTVLWSSPQVGDEPQFRQGFHDAVQTYVRSRDPRAFSRP